MPAPATDHITVPALVADPAAGDVVNHHPVAGPELLAAWTDLDDLSARLVSRDHSLVALGALAQVLAVDRPDVAAANRRGLHPHQNLAVAGFGDRVLLELDGAVARQAPRPAWCAVVVVVAHELVPPSRFQGGVISPLGSHRSSQVWPSFHRKTWPLISRQFRSIAAISRISCSVSGLGHGGLRLPEVLRPLDGEGDGDLPALDGPLHADHGRVVLPAARRCGR